MTWHCFDTRIARRGGYEFRFAGQAVRESAKIRSKTMGTTPSSGGSNAWVTGRVQRVGRATCPVRMGRSGGRSGNAGNIGRGYPLVVIDT